MSSITKSAVERVAALVQRDRGGYVCFSTVHMIMESHDSPEFGAIVNAADVIVPDGMPIVWMQELQGRKMAASRPCQRPNDASLPLRREKGVERWILRW